MLSGVMYCSMQVAFLVCSQTSVLVGSLG